MAIIVHHLNDSRSQRVLWLLEEMGIDYEIKHYSHGPAAASTSSWLIFIPMRDQPGGSEFLHVLKASEVRNQSVRAPVNALPPRIHGANALDRCQRQIPQMPMGANVTRASHRTSADTAGAMRSLRC
ncbi:hypothetical protein PANT_13d00109 [Moesziomyces antarcticus T-34]|uniref:GST N-terminal domain-containing protein n=1 Tax=Pseudozyma antarctica (strain T-34) TaxID=1151754 RepID=M9MG99_PSEA3|nr:hypothetical protein PANT_13d00109 [Moesziomyces antarcticus T-34]